MLFQSDVNFIKKEILRIAKGSDITRRWKNAKKLIQYIEYLIGECIPEDFERDLYSIAWDESTIFRRKKAGKLGINLAERYFKVVEWKEA